MSELRALNRGDAALPALRRAELLSVESDDIVWVRYHDALAEEVVRVELAGAQYEPVVGDWLLVAETPGERYAVGVLGPARRRASLRAPSELLVRAEQRIVLEAPEVEIRSHALELDARTIVERSESSHRFTGEAHMSCGRMRTLVEGAADVVAGRVSIVAEDDTHIDGRRVLLG